MPTEASLQALDGLRDLSTLKWYVIPMLAGLFYVYALATVANVVALGFLGWVY